MGQGASKSPSASHEHVFASATPLRFSQELLDDLQTSPENDSTRSKDLEHHIQSRVTAELSRLAAEQTQALHDLGAQISAAVPEPIAGGILDGVAPSPTDGTAREVSRQRVQREVEALKRRLEERKGREAEASDRAVEKARTEVVTCLRANDRRPLDCWREVGIFRREVGRLERGFLGRVLE